MSTSATPSTVKPTSLVPPFTAETAAQKVKAAENLWNTVSTAPSLSHLLVHLLDVPDSPNMSLLRLQKDPERVANAYTEETVWRNRDTFLKGRQDVVKFLKEKWNRETQYTLKKRLFATDGANRIAVQFWCAAGLSASFRFTL